MSVFINLLRNPPHPPAQTQITDEIFIRTVSSETRAALLYLIMYQKFNNKVLKKNSINFTNYKF